jgi:hypothetical protein
MKRISSFLLFYIILMIARAQDDPSPEVIRQGDTRYIRIGKAKKDEHLAGKIHFRGVRFIDNREDSSVAGYSINPENATVVKINFKGGMAGVNPYLNTNYKNAFMADKDSLIVIVNEFRIGFATYRYSGVADHRLIRMKLLLASKYRDHMALIGSYDTTLVYKRDFIHYYVACTKKALKNILERADDLVRQEGDQGGKMTEKQFFARYVPVNRPEYPILRDSHLQQGVYLNFRQFLANAPIPSAPEQGSIWPYPAGQSADSLPEYEEANDILAMNSLGANLDSNSIWGYCDGKIVYVNTGYEAGFYPFIRNGNGFMMASREKLRNPHPQKTVVTVVEIVGFVALIVAIGWLCRNSGSFPAISPGGGSPVIPVRQPPKIAVVAGGKTYRLWGAGIDMQTGKLAF